MRAAPILLLLLAPMCAGFTVEPGELPEARAGDYGVTLGGTMYLMNVPADLERDREIWAFDVSTQTTEVLDATLPDRANVPSTVNGKGYLPWAGTCGVGPTSHTCIHVSEFDPGADAMTQLTSALDSGMPVPSSEPVHSVWWPESTTNCPEGCMYIFDTQGNGAAYVPGAESGRAFSAAPAKQGTAFAAGTEYIYAFGGMGAGTTVSRFDPTDETWTVIEDQLPVNAFLKSSATWENKLIMTGWAGTSQYIGDAWVFDMTTETFHEAPWATPNEAITAYADVVGNTLYLVGGEHAKILSHPMQLQAPSISLAGPSSATTGQALTFSALTDDSDGLVESIAWDFGDGATSQGAQAQHSYANPGTFSIAATATDSDGLMTTDTLSVIVSEPAGTGGNNGGNNDPPPAPENQAPTAAFTATGSILRASFNAATSSDPDGDALTYAWSFGDGATGTGRAPSHDYANAESYTVTLTVSDGEDTDSASKTVTVTAPAAPVAALSISASSIIEGESITADASGSTQGSGANTFMWTLDGIAKGNGLTKSFTAGIGTHTVKLVVVNEYDQSSEAMKSFTVTARPVDPTPTPTATPTPTTSPPPTETPNAADKESPTGLFLIPALLAVAWLSRRK